MSITRRSLIKRIFGTAAVATVAPVVLGKAEVHGLTKLKMKPGIDECNPLLQLHYESGKIISNPLVKPNDVMAEMLEDLEDALR